jgi:hypothetical protein
MDFGDHGYCVGIHLRQLVLQQPGAAPAETEVRDLLDNVKGNVEIEVWARAPLAGERARCRKWLAEAICLP